MHTKRAAEGVVAQIHEFQLGERRQVDRRGAGELGQSFMMPRLARAYRVVAQVDAKRLRAVEQRRDVGELCGSERPHTR